MQFSFSTVKYKASLAMTANVPLYFIIFSNVALILRNHMRNSQRKDKQVRVTKTTAALNMNLNLSPLLENLLSSDFLKVLCL